MATEETQEIQSDDILNLSDEEFENYDFSQESSSGDEGNDSVSEDTAATEDTEPEEEDEEVDDQGDDSDNNETDDDSSGEASLDQGESDVDQSNDDTKDTSNEIDYKAEYEKLMAPFKANGSEISPVSLEDRIVLMQKGANYAKKMKQLKPGLKRIEMLKDYTDEQLNAMLDRESGNKEAIKALMDKHGIDSMDFDEVQTENYTPIDHSISDEEFAFNDAVNTISSSPSFDKTREIVSQKWDEASKSTIYKNPKLLKHLNNDVESGVYDIVMSAVESERTFGRLANMSDIEAYRAMGPYVVEELKKIKGDKPGSPAQDTTTAESAPVKKPTNIKQKKAAGVVKSKSNKVKANPFDDVLNMSDEEFAKMAGMEL